MLLIIFFLLILNILILFISSNQFKFNGIEIKFITLSLNLLIFALSLLLWLFFDNNIIYYQYVLFIKNDYLHLFFGIDGYSLFIVLLTTFIFPICILTSWDENVNNKSHLLYLLLIELFTLLTFTALDLFIFFISFEGTLIPMFLLIGGWGHNTRKIKASYYFFLYTFFGSLFILFNLLFIFTQYGTLNYFSLLNLNISFSNQLLIWICFFIPFAIKAPIFPFHIWIPEAHVEAPTNGSILLASLILKLGTYGILRFLLPLCPDANLYFLPITYALLLVGLLYTSITTIRQTDLKRIIAYSSVAHMTYVLLGLITYNYQSTQGAFLLMLAHGFTSTGLFFLVGVIYKRTHTRLLNYYGGVVSIMPLYTLFLFIFCAANFSLPITFNFIGEFLILIGLINQNVFVGLFATISIFLSLIYSMWFFNKLSFGNLKLNYVSIFTDLTRQELYIITPLVFFTFLFGIFPNLILNSLDTTLQYAFL
jgi:proton-translocating NADH-quinone oxidoreductase chain M